MHSELELLKWAAGVPAQVPCALDLDTDLLRQSSDERIGLEG
jgi:hypothetical protein